MKMSKLHVRYRPTRGFVKIGEANPNVAGHEGVFIRKGYKLVPCTGEAHSNGHIDNCSGCMSGEWGRMAVRDDGGVK